jgi:HK97 family phage portal protein
VSIFGRIEKRAVGLTAPDRWFNEIETVGTRGTHSGKKVSVDSALQLSAVYFCSSLIADSLAALPVDVYIGKGGKRKPVAKLPVWLSTPNALMTPFDFWHRVIISMLLEGNAYIHVIRDDKGNVLEVWPVHPSRVSVSGSSRSPVYSVDGKTMKPSEWLHIPAFAVADEVQGMSVLEAAKEAVGLGLTAEVFGSRFFAQGTTMAGVITMPGKLERLEAERLKADFAKGNSGTKNSHAVGVLSGGAQWTNISITPEQAQFLATRAYTKVDIALFFRVPAYMVDPTVTSSWGSGVEEQNWAFIQNTLQPWITRLEQAFFALLYGNQSLKFNLDARLRAKTADRYEAHQKAINNGFMSADEVRALEDLPPLPNGLGETFWRPANVIEVGKEPPPPPAPAAPPDPNAVPADDTQKV